MRIMNDPISPGEACFPNGRRYNFSCHAYEKKIRWIFFECLLMNGKYCIYQIYIQNVFIRRKAVVTGSEI